MAGFGYALTVICETFTNDTRIKSYPIGYEVRSVGWQIRTQGLLFVILIVLSSTGIFIDLLPPVVPVSRSSALAPSIVFNFVTPKIFVPA